MSTTLRKSTKHPIPLRHVITTTIFHGRHESTVPRQGRRRVRLQQEERLSRSSLSMSRMFHSSLYSSLNCAYSQASPFLSHSTSLHLLQERLLILDSRVLNHSGCDSALLNLECRSKGLVLNNFGCFPNSPRFDYRSNGLFFNSGKFSGCDSVLPNLDFRSKGLISNSRNFSGVTGDVSEVDSGDDELEKDDDECDFNEDECKGVKDGGVEVESGADLEEVNRVCKVIDELFSLDRNMEAVLDDCNIELSHDLVVDVLERFRHARKPAYRFFCWASEKEGFSHNSKTYNTMMSIFGKTKQFETMVALLEEMGEKGVLTLETFSIAIKAFAAAKERKKAVGIFELMKKYKFKVGVHTINCLLDNLGRAKLGKEAQFVFEKLEHRFTPNLQTYTVLLNGWCRVKNLLEAGRVWNEMIDKGFKPDIITHNTMIEGLLRNQKKVDAMKLVEVMKEKGPSPNVRSYTILIRDLCKHSKVNEAVKYFDEMVDSGCQPDAAVYTCLITGFGNLKKLDKVFGILKEMREKGFPPDGHTYNALIKLMTNRKMPLDAARVYNKMVQSGIEPTIHTYNMLMKSYFWTGNYDMGVEIWEEMNQRGCCPDDNSYTVFIGGLIRHGKSELACRYVEEMLEKGMKAPQLDYNKFAADFARNGKPDILAELAQKMKFAGKFDVSNVFARWSEMMKKRVKRRDPGNFVRSHYN